jgi:hypothetical protein
MTLLDTYLTGREKVLERILGIDPGSFLNPKNPQKDSIFEGSALAVRLRGAITRFKAIAMNEKGEWVDYEQLSLNPVYQSFREQVSQLREFELSTLASREEQLAFWINLYNSLVIDAVIQEDIKNSVTESRLGILSFFQKAAYLINGQRFSLTDIEHGIIRGNRGFPYFPGPHFSASDPRIEAIICPVDPRIHFALNCASKSCPPIGVYTAEEVDNQLTLASRNFIQQDLVIDFDQKTITISRIFHWYRDDFSGDKGIVDFLLNHIVNPKNQHWLENNRGTVRIKYHPYDWGLNQIKPKVT